MTEIEKMQRARLYMIKLAQGINPLTEESIDGVTVLSDIRFSRCFLYISDILNKVIENGGEVDKKARSGDLPFSFSKDILEEVKINQKAITVSEFTKNINNTFEGHNIRKVSYKMITQYLVENEYLQEIIMPDEKKTKGLTDKSDEIGITCEHRENQFKSYDVILYEEKAQRFILKNLESIIINYQNNKECEKRVKNHKNIKWKLNEEKQLILEFSSNLNIEQIAKRHSRTIEDINNKLYELGKLVQ